MGKIDKTKKNGCRKLNGNRFARKIDEETVEEEQQQLYTTKNAPLHKNEK